MELSSLIDIKKRPTDTMKVRSERSEVDKEVKVGKAVEVGKSNKEIKSEKGLKKISLSPKMKKRSKKRPNKPTKDIFQIEQQIQKLSTTKPKSDKSEKGVPKISPKISPQNSGDDEKPATNSDKIKMGRRRSRNRSRRRSHSKRKMKKGRQVKVKPAKVSEDDLATIKKRIKNIRDKSSKEIKEDLREKGIQVSGKSDRLLKDIYFYSKVCNLNIVHEK